MKTEKTEWYNGTFADNGIVNWPPMHGEMQFAYSSDQKQVTISHLKDLKIGITFSSEVRKRFDTYNDLLNALIVAKKDFDKRVNAVPSDDTHWYNVVCKAIEKATENK